MLRLLASKKNFRLVVNEKNCLLCISLVSRQTSGGFLALSGKFEAKKVSRSWLKTK